VPFLGCIFIYIFSPSSFVFQYQRATISNDTDVYAIILQPTGVEPLSLRSFDFGFSHSALSSTPGENDAGRLKSFTLTVPQLLLGTQQIGCLTWRSSSCWGCSIFESQGWRSRGILMVRYSPPTETSVVRHLSGKSESDVEISNGTPQCL
jgi:hypothetical protein